MDDASSPAVDEIARKSHARVLQHVARTNQAVVAERIRTSPSTVCRFIADDLYRAIQILAAVGLKIVPTEHTYLPPRRVQVLVELARDRLNSIRDVTELEDDDGR